MREGLKSSASWSGRGRASWDGARADLNEAWSVGLHGGTMEETRQIAFGTTLSSQRRQSKLLRHSRGSGAEQDQSKKSGHDRK